MDQCNPNAANTQSHNPEDIVMMESNQSISSEELPDEDPEPASLPPTVSAHYYSISTAECPDEVFVPPCRLEPEEGGTCDLSVSPRSSDGTEANTNPPECLDWLPGEKLLMTSGGQVSEETEESVLATFEEVVRSDSANGSQSAEEEQGLLDKFKVQEVSAEEGEQKCSDAGLNDPKLKKVIKLHENTDLLDNIGLKQPRQNIEKLQQTGSENDQNEMEEILTSQEEVTDGKFDNALDNNLTGYDWVRRTGVEEDDKASTEHEGLENTEETNGTMSDSRIATENLLQRLQLVQQRQDLEDFCLQSSKLEEHMMTDENVASETKEDNQEDQSDEENQPNSSLVTMAAQFTNLSLHETEECVCTEETDVVRNENICMDLEQDVHMVGRVQMTEEPGLKDDCNVIDINDENIGAEERICSCEEDEQKLEDAISPNLSPQHTDTEYTDEPNVPESETQIMLHPCHRLSAVETSTEKQESLIKYELQRAEGVFDLTENPDVLEIPFKTNISLESLPMTKAPPGVEKHFSEQKMQKEISQEMQREMVLVNLGKIPGEYSRGESRHMKDTKLLFEAFQQEKTEGPTRIRKPQASLPKSHVSPSVLERTRSLERFSQKMSPIFRTHSFRLVSTSEKEKNPETFRPLSPSLRDKTRLSPYPKHEKHTRMHKSMDSINTSSASGLRGLKQETTREGSPLLKENPFFKLRPALSLQPEVEKDIREAKKREEELRKQRCSLYGENRQGSREEGRSTTEFKTDLTHKTTGRLERVWPPPSKKDTTKSEQQEAKVQRGHRAALWQRWESGLINGQTPANTNNKNN